jgi:hypothetical protein
MATSASERRQKGYEGVGGVVPREGFGQNHTKKTITIIV